MARSRSWSKAQSRSRRSRKARSRTIGRSRSKIKSETGPDMQNYANPQDRLALKNL